MSKTILSEPVCIPANVEPQFLRQCSVDEEWQQLEQFWDGEKHRLQQDGTEIKSNSLEEDLLFNDFVKEPSSRKGTFEESVEIKVLKGDEIKDIPTSYVTGGFKPHELIVIGTYVDKNILPGFRYLVRKNLSDDHLFDGRALYLDSVGQGYGKRLTFEAESLNDNSRYFWSDSHRHGLGFTPRTTVKDDVYRILNGKKDIGRLIVNEPAATEDQELHCDVNEAGVVEKSVQIHWKCDVVFSDANGQNVFAEDSDVKGVAKIVRGGQNAMAEVVEVQLTGFLAEGCHLVPE